MNEAPDRQSPHPFPRSVEAFEEILKRAHQGTIAAFAVMWVDPYGVVGWKWHFGTRPQTDVIGGIHCMQWTITTNAMAPIPMPEPPTDVRQ
jgi:hypothetical protein